MDAVNLLIQVLQDLKGGSRGGSDEMGYN